MRNSTFSFSPGEGAINFRSVAFDPRRERREMVRELCEEKGIRNNEVLQAMAAVPRHLFVQEALQAHAYQDTSLPIGFGQTISQPSTVAKMTELLEVEKGTRVLEVGTGSGYQAAILASIGCHVFSLERISELCRSTTQLLKRLGYTTVHVHRGDGTLGFPQASPYDRIIVTAGGPKIPAPLVRQLAEGGLMLIPVGERPRDQKLVRVRKTGAQLVTDILDSVIFVNLVGDEGWRE